MKFEDLTDIEELVDELLELPESERSVAIERRSELAPSVRAALQRVVGVEGEDPLGSGICAAVGDFIDRAARSTIADGPSDHAPTLDLGDAPLEVDDHGPGDVLGAYRLVEEIGRGGMGQVFLAERIDGQFDQVAAIKIIRSGSAVGIEQRFLQERRILAGLEHPNVARLFDGGISPKGVPYFVMELVDGRSIHRYCAEERLDLEQRVRLFLQVCDAVAHAHRNLVVHRDLKPGNILVTGAGQVKLLDFGIAKALDPSETESAEMVETRVLGRVLTPRYAAPEQLLGEGITTATDVFALGLVLAELLVGPGALQARGESIADAIRWHDSELPSLSGALASFEEREAVAEAARTSVAKLRRAVRGDLDAIVARCLRRDPSDRYGSSAALRADLERYLEGLPVSAARTHWLHRLQLFARRNRTVMVAGAAVLVTVVGGWISTARQADRAQQERDRALAAEQRAVALNRYLVDDVLGLARPEESGGRDLTLRELLEVASRRAESALAESPELGSAIHGAIGETYLSLGDLERAERDLVRSLAVIQQAGLGSSPEAWRAERLMARLRRAQGDAQQAGDMLQRLLAEPPRALDPAEIASTRILLGEVLAEGGDRARAERELREVLGLLERPGGVSAGEALRRQALYALSSILQAQRRSADATVLAQELLALQRESLGDEHPEVMDTLQLLADTASRMQKNDEAMSFQRRVLELRSRVLGEAHPKTVASRIGVGTLLRRRGARAEALEVFESAASHATASLGPSVETVRALNGLAVAQRDMGLPAAAQQSFAEALEMSRVIHGEAAPVTVRIMKNLVSLYLSTGESPAAAEMSRRVIAIGLEASASAEPDWTTLQDLADFIVRSAPPDVRDLDLGEKIASQAVELSDRKAPEALAELADVYRLRGDLDRGIALLEEAYELPDAIYLYSMERSMMFMLEEVRGLPAAGEFLARQLERRLDARAENSPVVLTSRWLIGRNLLLQGRLTEAEEQLRLSLDAARQQYEATDDYVLRVRLALGQTLERAGRREEAIAELVPACRTGLEVPFQLTWVLREGCLWAADLLRGEGRAGDARELLAALPPPSTPF